jgi:hypothetical protein
LCKITKQQRNLLASLTGDPIGGMWDIPSGDTGILGPANRTTTGEANKPFVFVQLQNQDWATVFPPSGKPLIYTELMNYSDSALLATDPRDAFTTRPSGTTLAASGQLSNGQITCTTSTFETGIRDCDGNCFTDALCTMAIPSYSNCAQVCSACPYPCISVTSNPAG